MGTIVIHKALLYYLSEPRVPEIRPVSRYIEVIMGDNSNWHIQKAE